MSLILNLLPLNLLCSFAYIKYVPLEDGNPTSLYTDYSPEATPPPLDTHTSEITPMPVETDLPQQSPLASPYWWKDIFANNRILVGILNDGSLWQWNNYFPHLEPFELNEFQQANIFGSSPVKMLENVVDVSIGYIGNILALTNDNKLWSWGDNGYGQIGDGTMTYRQKPVCIIDDVYKIYTDDYAHCFAIKNDQTLWRWGSSIDDNIEHTYTTPEKLMDNVTEVASGPDFVLILKNDNSLWGLGYDSFGVLGDNSDISGSSQVPVKIMDDVKRIKVKDYSCYAIKQDNSLWTWGDNQFGQLGYGKESDNIGTFPQKILDGVADVIAAAQSAYALMLDYSVYSWGSNEYGQLGRNLEIGIYTPGIVMDNIKELSSIDSHVLALDNTGYLYGWGYNWDSQLGSDESSENEESYAIYEPILLSRNISKFTTTYNASCYINNSGELFILGYVFGSYHGSPLFVPIEPFIISAALSGNMIEVSMFGIDTDSVSPEEFTVNNIINGSSQAVTFEIYSIDSNLNTVTLKVPEITPSDTDTKVAYSLSYRGNVDKITNEIIIPTPVSPTITPVSPTSSSTPTPTRTHITYNSSTSYTVTPTPEASSTPTPSSTATPSLTTEPSNTPMPGFLISETDYNKKLDDFETEVKKIADQYKGIEDLYDDMNELLIKKAEKVIEDISLRRVKIVDDNIDITNNFILPQSQIAKEAKDDISNILKGYLTEDIREINARVNILVDGYHDKINLNYNKDIVDIMKEKIDVKVSTNLGNIVLYNKYIESQLKDNMTITLTESKKTSVDIKNVVSGRINLRFTSPISGTIKKLNQKIGYELPYGNANPEYSTILHELDGKIHNMGGHEDLDNKILYISTAFAGDYVVVEDEKSFQDIGKEDSEMKKAIQYLASKGIISGRNNTTFDPNAFISRSEFTSLIVKSLNLIDDDAANNFVDVSKNAWYYNVVSIACSQGIIHGYEDNTFRGMRVINRQEIHKICAATLVEKVGYYYPKNLDKYLNFADKDSIPEWAGKYAALGNREGLIVKKPDNCFNGIGSCTRGEAAIIMYRLYKKL